MLLGVSVYSGRARKGLRDALGIVSTHTRARLNVWWLRLCATYPDGVTSASYLLLHCIFHQSHYTYHLHFASFTISLTLPASTLPHTPTLHIKLYFFCLHHLFPYYLPLQLRSPPLFLLASPSAAPWPCPEPTLGPHYRVVSVQ